ncbi:MAG: SH3 domain-containing protein [Firmicutes bacterium]|nr:SH3 domain-containing protein [Bacillota bacterium]NSW89319.1 SH3 domain-containing protein [Bacillota bacterium]
MYKLSKTNKFTKVKMPLSVFTVVLLFILYSPIIYADTLKEGIVNVEYLNVRQNPSTSATIVGQLLKDTEVKINDNSGDWYNITFNNLTGWVYGDYVTVKEASTSSSGESPKPTGSTGEEDKKTGVVTATVLNVREGAGTSTKVIAQLNNGMEVKILEEDNTKDAFCWYKVNYGNINGWVSGEYISFKNEPIDEGVVNVSVANVRSGPSLTSGVVTQLKSGSKVNIYSWYGEWYKIKLEDGSFAWIFGELVTTRKSLLPRSSLASRGGATGGESSSSLGQQIVNYAKKFLGVRYVWGGTSPNGFDCSGLVQYVFRQFGISLNRVAADQAKQGTKVTRAQLKPGDLVFFNTDSDSVIDHVGIYIGNNQFIHASNGRGKVLIDPLNSGYYNGRLVTARRIVN